MAEKVKTIINSFLEKLGVNHNGIDLQEVAGQELYSIVVDESDSGILIGQRGEALRALNKLVAKILEKDLGERVRITIDINDYKKSKIDNIIATAQMHANRAKELQYDVELQPANGYERMLVHAHLADDPELTTVSIGEGPERRVVIKWVGLD